MNRKSNNWLFAFLLTLPMVCFYMGYFFNHSPDLTPTGFIQYDNVSYIAFAKQYIDADRFSFFYSNPFSDSGSRPAIYFQPQTVLFAFLLKSGVPPVFILIPFSLLCAFLFFRILIGIYDQLYPKGSYRTLCIIFFSWGGGLLALSGLSIPFIKPIAGLDFFDQIFYADPAWGWWGLNIGRSLFISTEAWYHLIFMSAVLCVLKEKWSLCIVLLLLLSLSHPFTGIELLSIICFWVVVEKVFFQNKIPFFFAIGAFILLAFHIFFYLFYLQQFTEHKSVSEQYALNWRLRFFNMLPAYFIVGLLTLISILKLSWKKYFKLSSNRLFACWFIIAFLLANHELFIKPMQPIHFTRGYIWASLFLSGIPAIYYLFDRLKLKSWGNVAIMLAGFAFLSDNLLWIINYTRFPKTTASESYLSKEQLEILNTVKNNSDNSTLLISSDPVLPYISTVYTKAYPWISHPYTTPFAEKKKKTYEVFLDTGVIDSSWYNRKLLFIFSKKNEKEVYSYELLMPRKYLLKETENYLLVSATYKRNTIP